MGQVAAVLETGLLELRMAQWAIPCGRVSMQ